MRVKLINEGKRKEQAEAGDNRGKVPFIPDIKKDISTANCTSFMFGMGSHRRTNKSIRPSLCVVSALIGSALMPERVGQPLNKAGRVKMFLWVDY